MISSLIDWLITLLAWLAVPVTLVAAYDRWELAPKRPKTAEGEPTPGPTYARVANFLFPFAILCAVIRIGVSDVFAWAREIAEPLAWAAIPVGIVCVIDSWIFAPRRLIESGARGEIKDPILLRAAYALLPVLVIAVIIRMISTEKLDFSLVLLLLSIGTGVLWLVDTLVFRGKREQALKPLIGAEEKPPEPGTVDYARSFFPVAFIVLIVRAFIFEPFRIPSDSMMPTLLDGDFIVVNKWAYGLRWPVLNTKFLDTGTPQRGEVVVFRYPRDPNINYIKRLVGLPGDRVEVHDDHLVVNGQTIPLDDTGRYNDGCYIGFRVSKETLGTHTHNVISCRSPTGWVPSRAYGIPGNAGEFPACDRKHVAETYGNLVCSESGQQGAPDSNDHAFDVVPAGFYLMIGDNRDNSGDSREWGLVPDQNLVGKATRIWFNLDPQRKTIFNWRRIGQAIE